MSVLGPLRGLTLTAPDPEAVAAAWQAAMGYRLVARGTVSKALAENWGAPAAAGRATLSLAPASGHPTTLCLVEQPHPPGWAAMTTPGWGAIELVVQDPDDLARRLEGSGFEVLLQPHGVDGYPHLRALQAMGPSGEMLNLTRADPPPPDLPVAQTPVDHCFIATLGVPDMAAAIGFYRGALGTPVGAVHQVRLSLVNWALRLPRETRHPLAVVALPGRTKIELDELPAGADARPVGEAGLPAGLAVVSFGCADLAAVRAPFLAPPIEVEGRRRATIVGQAGELIELVEDA